MGSVQGLDQVNLTLTGVLERLQNPKPAYHEIGILFANEFIENFRAGGRPPWTPSERVKKHGGMTLIKSRRLMKSVTVPNIIDTGIEFGSNLPYAAIHQFGGDIQMPARSELFVRARYTRGSKSKRKGMFKRGTTPGKGFTRSAYTIKIDPRPYITLTDAMNRKAGEIIVGYAMGQK